MPRKRKKTESRKKPYEPPRIVTVTLYERYGLACGKATPINPACQAAFMS